MNYAIILAAGKGSRMKKSINKVFLPLLDKPMIYHSIKAFQDCDLIDGIIIAAQKDDIKKMNDINQKYGFSKIKGTVEGGKERQDSVYNGLKSVENASADDVIVVHNGSNPLVKQSEIARCINEAGKFGAAAASFPLRDTIKKIKNGFVEKTLDRKDVYQMQTPQAIRYGIFVEAFKNARSKRLRFTDDVSLVEALGRKVKIVQCSYENIKVTTEGDLKIAESIMSKAEQFRVGFGQDSHRFSLDKGKKLVLGGYIVPNETGLEANSDGDLVLHALFNAISSAIGGNSLGYYADSMLEEGITDSKEYLKVILKKLSGKNMGVNNISISIEARKPRLDSYTGKIKGSLAKILNIERERIGITCTSGEGLTEFGRGQGMQCLVVVTIK